MKSSRVFVFVCIISVLNSFIVRKLGAKYLKDCKIKIHELEWEELEKCDLASIDPQFDYNVPPKDLNISYNLGEKVYVWIKTFSKLPSSYEYMCNMNFELYINEYYINNNFDYIYYCSNCECAESYNNKTFCHLNKHRYLDCNPTNGKEYEFYFMINGYNELNLMEASTVLNNYYQINGRDYYLSENETKQEIKFSSNSILKSSYYPEYKVILDELLIKYSFEGNGEFRTINDEHLDKSGEIGSDIIFIKPNNITGDKMLITKLTVQTISKFGKDKGNTTSETAQFNFYYCPPGYKLNENKECFKCFESCADCLEPGNEENHHCNECNEQNPYYFDLDGTKNCYNSCKSANKIRKEKNSHICINTDKCETFISSDEESCVVNCSLEYEYFDNRTGKLGKNCLSKCDDYASNDNKICVDSCKRINQLINKITLNKKCTTENLCALYKQFIDSNNIYCLENCSLVSELQDYRNKEYTPYCLPSEKCDTYISSDGAKCIHDCPSEIQYFDDRKETRSKKCLKKEMCDSWISSNDTICLNDCKLINELSDMTSKTCAKSCRKDLFYTPELMTCSEKCNEPYKYYITNENKTKKCVKKCDEFPYIVSDEDNFECLSFKKFEITSIQANAIINSNNENYPVYYVDKDIKDLKIKITFNQNIRNRLQLIDGTYEKIKEENNSIIIKISELNEDKTFKFSDNLDKSYNFGFELKISSPIIVSYIDTLSISLIVICVILFILLIVVLILFCKNKKNNNKDQEMIVEVKKNSLLY